MKKLELFLAVCVLSPFYLWSQNNTTVQGETDISSSTLLWNGVTVSAGWSLQIPLRESYSLSEGLELLPGTTSVSLSKKNSPTKDLGRLGKIVVSIGGEWWLLVPNTKGSVDKFALSNFSNYPAASIKSLVSAASMRLPGLPVSFGFRVSSVVNGAPPVPAANPIAQEVSFDPRMADGRTFYLMDSALKNGVKLTLEDALDFESGSPLLQGYSPAERRATLLYWVMGIRTIDVSRVIAQQIPNFKENLYTDLNLSANSGQSAELRFKVLALLRSVLEYHTTTEPSLSQSWGFPTSRLYWGANGAPAEYEHLYFKILSISSRVSSLTDVAVPVPLDKRELLANRAVEYLYGDHDGSSSLGLQYEQVRTMPSGTGPSIYLPTEDLGLRQTTDVLSNYAEQTGGTTEFVMTLPSTRRETFNGTLVYFPPSPNVLNDESLLAPQSVSSLLSSATSLTAWQSSTVTLEFKAARKLSSLLFWWGNDTNLTSIEYLSTGGNFVAVPADQRAITYATLGHVNNSPQWSLVAGRTTDLGLAAVNLSNPIQSTKIILRFNSNTPRLYNVRGYEQPVNLLGGPSWSGEGTSTLAIRGYFSKQLPELFRTNGPNNMPYFIQTGGATVAGASTVNLPRYLRPISYLKSGLETPRSFSLKVINNHFYKKKLLEKSRFPLTEFDLSRQGTVDGQFNYLDFPLPAKPYSDLLQFDTENVMYPYSYGIQIPTKAGIIANPNSPLYVEKLAGVDSMGLLVSLLQTVGLSTKSPSEFKTRFDSRAGLSSYRAVLEGTPWSNYPANTKYQWDRDWFLRNSVVVSDLSAVQKGDLLVGYEGSELTVGVVVAISGNGPISDLESAQRRLVVVTVNAGTQRVTYSSWLSMSPTPERYHIRRLVTTASSSDIAPSAIEGFLHFHPTLSYTLDLPSDTDQFRTWIPNTTELSPIGRIKLSAAEASIPDGLVDGSSWSLSHAWDYYSDRTEVANISKNVGQTVFHLVAISDDTGETGETLTAKDQKGFYVGPRFVDLYRLSLDPSKTRYDIVANPRLGVEWTTRVNQQVLQVAGDGFLYTKFAVIAENPKPGEDIGLSFTINSAYGQWISLDSKSPRLAVYDKKMLWRANLYIDEGGGGADWNDRHPWVTDNEWNFGFDASKGDGIGSQPGKGGQTTKIYGWTRPFDGGSFRSSTRMALGNVSYGLGATDTPFSFNLKMLSQQNALNQVMGAMVPPQTWGTTYAPIAGTQSDWLKYAKSLSQNAWTAPNYPWRPNYSTVMKYGLPVLTGVANADYDFSQVGETSGLDCNGFLQRAASYVNSPYSPKIVITKSDDAWKNPHASTQKVAVGSDATPKLKNFQDDYSDLVSPGATGWGDNPDNLQFAVPGDFILLYGNGDSHVSIIQQIDPTNLGQDLTRRNFSVIHSTMGKDWSWMVRKGDYWQRDNVSDNIFTSNSDIWYSKGFAFELRRLR